MKRLQERRLRTNKIGGFEFHEIVVAEHFDLVGVGLGEVAELIKGGLA